MASSRGDQPDPFRWFDEWSVPCLSTDDRNQIKAVFLKSHSLFLGSYFPHDPHRLPLAPYEPMRLAFAGISQVLFDAGVLTAEALQGELRLLVLECAIAGNWWQNTLGVEARPYRREEILPGQLGHSNEWIKLHQYYPLIFEAETAMWEARLLEAHLGRPTLPEESQGRITLATKEATGRLEQDTLLYTRALLSG